MRGLSLVAVSGDHSLAAVQGLPVAVFLLWISGFRAWDFLVAERGLCSCGTQAWSPCSMCDFLGAGGPVSPALAGGFLTTEPPGKSVLDISKLQGSSVNIFSCCKPPENLQCTVFKSRYKWTR